MERRGGGEVPTQLLLNLSINDYLLYSLYVRGYAWSSVDPVDNASLLKKLGTDSNNLRNYKENKDETHADEVYKIRG